jgi:ribosomal protein S18 acetylase RimI-like enzyme
LAPVHERVLAEHILDRPACGGAVALRGLHPGALLVAEIDGVLAGSLIAAWDGWRGSFYQPAVSPEHRRRGLAR